MTNIINASENPLCQKAKKWLIKNKGFIDKDAVTSPPDGTYSIHLIMTDEELLKGVPHAIPFPVFRPPGDFIYSFIFCSVTSKIPEKKHLIHAISFANIYNCKVHLGTSIVYKAWNDALGESLVKDFYEVNRDTRPESSLEGFPTRSY